MKTTMIALATVLSMALSLSATNAKSKVGEIMVFYNAKHKNNSRSMRSCINRKMKAAGYNNVRGVNDLNLGPKCRKKFAHMSPGQLIVAQQKINKCRYWGKAQ